MPPPAVQIGDVFALLIYYFHQQRNWGQAHKLIEEMRTRGIQLEPFLEPTVIDEVYRYVKGARVAVALWCGVAWLVVGRWLLVVQLPMVSALHHGYTACAEGRAWTL